MCGVPAGNLHSVIAGRHDCVAYSRTSLRNAVIVDTCTTKSYSVTYNTHSHSTCHLPSKSVNRARHQLVSNSPVCCLQIQSRLIDEPANTNSAPCRQLHACSASSRSGKKGMGISERRHSDLGGKGGLMGMQGFHTDDMEGTPWPFFGFASSASRNLL